MRCTPRRPFGLSYGFSGTEGVLATVIRDQDIFGGAWFVLGAGNVDVSCQLDLFSSLFNEHGVYVPASMAMYIKRQLPASLMDGDITVRLYIRFMTAMNDGRLMR